MIHKLLFNVAVVLYVLGGLTLIIGIFLLVAENMPIGIALASGSIGAIISGLFLHAIGQIGEDLQTANRYLEIIAFGDDEDDGEEDMEEDEEEEGRV